MNARLSFAVPTYRRPEQLARCLRSLIAAAEPYRVAIHVADDSTSTLNEPVLAEARRRYPLVHAHRNGRNLGIDGNILHSADLPETEFVWLMGEDDRIVPHAVERVLAALNIGPPPAFLFVNYASLDERVRLVLRERALPLSADGEWPADRFLAEYGWAAGFIGGCVINKERWNRTRPDAYLGTYFAHVGRIFESVAGASVRVAAEPLVWNRCGTAKLFTWTGQAFEVLEGWSRMIAALAPYYPAEIRQAAVIAFRRTHGLDSLKFLAYLRADAAYDARAWREIIRPRGGSAAYRWGAWALAHLPAGPLNFLRACFNRWRFRRCRRVADPGETPKKTLENGLFLQPRE